MGENVVAEMKAEVEELQLIAKDLRDENAKLNLKEEMYNMNSTVTDLKATVSELKAENVELRESLKKTEKMIGIEVSELKAKSYELECKSSEMEKEVAFLVTPPYFHICVYRLNTNVRNSNIQFHTTLYYDCNDCSEAN